MTEGLISSSCSVVHSSRNSSTGPLGEPTVMYAMRARFLTRPTFGGEGWGGGVGGGVSGPGLFGLDYGRQPAHGETLAAARRAARGAKQHCERPAPSGCPGPRRTAWPSGVSAGHIMPHSVLCSCRGLASLPSRPMGELMRRRWDSVDA
jgi:hypothetical protein